MDLASATALETAAAVRAGKVSALEVCDAAIARIEAKDGPINAVVVRDFERARAAAKALDASGRTDLPLAGVAMTVKESNDVAGLPSTWGIPAFASLDVAEDAVAVARLKAAGAVILGKTNAPVALADWQSANPVYGRTNHPRDASRGPGGSSGGAAAAVASGMVPLEVGSDIGGSIRVPAHLCGVWGLKPSWGVIPLKGHGFPGTDSIDVDLAVVGPMARSVADVAAAFDILAGPVDPGYALALPAARHDALRDYRVLVLDTHPVAATDAGVRGPLNALARALEEAGVQILRAHADLPDLAAAHATYVRMLNTITSRGAPGADVLSAHAWMDLKDEQARLIRRWRGVFRDVDVVLAPAFGVPAFPHNDDPDWSRRRMIVDGKETPYGAQLGWPGVATFPHLPALAAPIAETADGFPVGIQIIAGPFEDRTALKFGALLAQAGLAR